MSAGRLIAVAGPSGVGKDSVIAALATADPRFEIVRRVITRPPGPGEAFDSVDEATFARRREAGEFCLCWRAHGLGYGIPHAVEARVAGGVMCIVNLSRAVLAEASAKFPAFTVIELTARPETLAERLAGRGRETPDDVARRLAHEGSSIPGGLDQIRLANDGPLRETVDAALQALRAPVNP